jgi:type III restriction enzyme
VIAKETYQEFADNLQKEIEEDTGIPFGIVLEHQFAAVSVTQPDGSSQPLGFERSKELWQLLREAGYVDARGRVQDALRTALRTASVVIPEPFAAQAPQIKDLLRKMAGRLEIRNADERRQVKTRQAILHGEDFKALWERIRTRTTYRVQFDNARLVDECTRALREAPPVTRARLHWRKADLEIGKSGIEAHQKAGDAVISLNEGDIELPDLLTELQDRTQLTRRSIHRMVTESGRLRDFLMNPQEFIRNAAEAINRAKRLALVDGIRYQRLGSEAYFAQELFEQEELSGYLRSMIAANKSVHEYVIYQSDTERSFAEQLERNEDIKVYAKLPAWFRVPTPLGAYNPDWAVLVQRDGGERLYLVVETKSSLFADDLRDVERGKIRCGQAHFREVAGEINPARFLTASRVEEVLDGP